MPNNTGTFKRGGPPPEAVSYLEGKGFKQSFHWQDVWGEEHAHNFTVAKAMEMDVLRAIREETDAAVLKGLPFEQFAAQLTPKLVALGWWGKQEMTDPLTGEIIKAQLGSPRRLQIIYWANTRAAYAAGQWERAQRTKAGLPYFVYELGPSERHRPHHQALANAPTILPVDHSFWDSHYPPNGWGCKCRLRQITRYEAQSLGGESSEPEIQYQDFRNKRTGEVSRIPVGVDPGWHTNPGKARARTLMQGLSERIDQSEPLQAKQIIADLWGTRSYAEQIANPKAKDKDYDQKDVSDETRNSWQGRNMESLLGITAGPETRSRNAYREYQQSRNAAPAAKKAEEKQRALQDRISNIIPAGRDFTDMDARDRSNPVDQGALKKAVTISDIQKSLGGSTLGPTSGVALPIPTSRGAVIRASGMGGQNNLPQIDKAMEESGIKAKAAAENTKSSIERILGSMDTYAAGLKAGNQFASGLRASSGQAAAAANEVASSVAGHFPQSPAKVGPLRKLPLMGQKISAQLAGGMERRSPIKAAHKIASDIAQSSSLQGNGAAAAGASAGGGRGPIAIDMSGMNIHGVSDPVALGNHLGDSIRRRLDGILGDVGNG